MSRLLSLLAVAALTAGVFAMPQPAPPVPGEGVAPDPADVMVCPAQEGSGRTTSIAVVSPLAGPGTVTLFTAGLSAGSVEYATGASGSALVPVGQIAAVGTAAALVELPGAGSAAGTLISGGGSLAHEACVSSPVGQTLLAGGSTLSGESLEVQVMNPYAGEALVDVTVRSESGVETLPELVAIPIPTRSSAIIDLDRELPGRESVTVTVEATRGRVLVSGRQGNAGDEAVWSGVAPAQDWYLPIPAGVSGEIVVATGLAVEVAFQLDVYGPDGVVEGAREGVVPPQGSVSVPLADLAMETAGAVRVISAQPVGVFLRTVTADTVALTSGAVTGADRWLLPGAGSTPSGTGAMLMLNTGLEDADVVLTSLRDQSQARQLLVPAGQVVEFAGIEGPGRGYSIRSSQPLVALWVGAEGAAHAYSIGVAFVDG